MKISLNLANYPHLDALFEKDQKEFQRVLKHIMTQTNQALEKGYFELSNKVYGTDFLNMQDDIIAAFFEPEGIADQHYNQAEKEGLKGLGENLHPLAIFTNNAPVYNAKGENISPQKWIEQGEFDLKNWLYALFYGARFVSWQELSEYLSLGRYDLVDVLKARNFEQLASIQPQLEIQKEKGIPVGKLVPGTGKLDIED